MKIRHIVFGIILLISLFPVAGCEKLFLPEPEANPEALFESFWQSFQDDYALFEERGVNWDALYLQFRPLVHENTTAAGLYEIFTRMLETINDGHVALAAPQVGYYQANQYFRERRDDDLFDLELIRQKYLEPGYRSLGKHYTYGMLAGHEAAYIHFDQFRASNVRLGDMLRDFPDAKGYIIDLRHNIGGDVSHSFDFLGRFIRERQLFLESKTKNGKGPDDYTPWYQWYLSPSGSFIDKPIVILTDRYTVSAAERMVMAARTLPGITVVGDTTNGTFGTKISREMANGWRYSYSIQKVRMFDGRSYEGVGLPPDIRRINNREDMRNGVDAVLEEALNQLK